MPPVGTPPAPATPTAAADFFKDFPEPEKSNFMLFFRLPTSAKTVGEFRVAIIVTDGICLRFSRKRNGTREEEEEDVCL